MTRLQSRGTLLAMADPTAHIKFRLDQFFAAHTGSVRVLEAGCGSLNSLRLADNAHIVGLDVSAEALAKEIHERIEANLDTCDLGATVYDLIVCWDVLEHLAEPIKVVRKLLRTVKPGGLVLLRLPNVLSVKGIVAKYTPFSFHLRVHRLIYSRRAGVASGYEIYPTYLRSSLAPRSLANMALRDGFAVEFIATYESGMQRRSRERFRVVVVRLLSIGALNAEASDCVLILRRPDIVMASAAPTTRPGRGK